MHEIFGLSMNVIMAVLVAIFLTAMVVMLLLGVRNPIMLKMGVRPIPRRPGQTILIIVGVMLSTVMISAAFGTGDTISDSVRNEALRSLKTIDEVIVPVRADASDSFASRPFVTYERFEQLQRDLVDVDDIDGLTPQIGETVPSVNPRSGLGVISTRAVVERRQQIGVLRAIGYRRAMIQLSFLLEASFISLLGILIGTALGIVLGWQAYNDIKQEEGLESLRFAVPWLRIAIILAVTYGFSLLATFISARQASRIYPAEALRYE